MKHGKKYQPAPPNWKYGDLPQLKKDMFLKFVEIVGEDNITWLTRAAYGGWDGETYYRGQYFISPEGFSNISSWLTSQKAE